MKIQVNCTGCGSAFAAPAMLAGQSLRCPKCNAVIDVPLDAAPVEDAAGQSRAGGTGGAGGSVFGQRVPGVRAQTKASAQDEVQARMSRLYGMYAQKQLHVKRRGRFTIGLGVCVGVVLLGLTFGGIMLSKTMRSGQLTNSTPGSAANNAAVTNNNAAGHAQGGSIEPLPTVDPTWKPPQVADKSPIVLGSTRVNAQLDDSWRGYGFTVRLRSQMPDDKRLDIGTHVGLYRTESASAPYKLVAHTSIDAVDARTSELVFKLADPSLGNVLANKVYYRLSGFDSQGRRLFDTPSAPFAVFTKPKLHQGRVTWQPVVEGTDAPQIECLFYLDVPGWEDVLVERISSSTSIDQVLPNVPMQAPLRMAVSLTKPSTVQLASDGRGAWTVQRIERDVMTTRSDQSVATSLRGVVPVWDKGKISYKLLPDKSAFVDVALNGFTRPGLAGGGVLSFRTSKGAEATYKLPLPGAAVPHNLIVTPFDREVRLSWDNNALFYESDAYEEEVAVAIYRSAAGSPRDLLGMVPLRQNFFSDKDVEPGRSYTYELSVTRGSSEVASAPLMRADCWVMGIGLVPVLVKSQPVSAKVAVHTESSLSRLTVSVGPHELCEPYTCRPAIQLMAQIIGTLLGDDQIAVIERGPIVAAGLNWRGARQGRPGVPGVPGVPAHVRLRLVDGRAGEVTTLALWASDLVSGESTLLGQTTATDGDHQGLVDSLLAYLQPRRRSAPVADLGYRRSPTRVIFGQLVPADQQRMFYGSANLLDHLIDALTQKDAQKNEALDIVRPGRRDYVNSDQLTLPMASDNGFGGDDAVEVLLDGRTWTTPEGKAGLRFHALDPASGRLIDTFMVPAVGAATADSFVTWFKRLELSENPDGATGGAGSALLGTEQGLEAIHPVWRKLAGSGRPRPSGDYLINQDQGAKTNVWSVGIPLPAQLGPMRAATMRKGDDPLAVVRPYKSAHYPLTFVQWAQAYARYIEADFKAFEQAYAQINGQLQAARSPITPRLIVRGQEVLLGSSTITNRGKLDATPTALNLRQYLKVGVSAQPLLDYHSELAEQFRHCPWAGYHVWKQVRPELAQPFLKTELFGVKNQSYGRLTTLKRPPPLYRYVAGTLLADAGNPAARMFKKTALQLSASAFKVLKNKRPMHLSREDREYSSNAMLILLFESDPAAITMLANPQTRDRYLAVAPGAEADTLRLMVDRIGSRAWKWTSRGSRVGWDRFLWRSDREMRLVLNDFSPILPRSIRMMMTDRLAAATNAHSAFPMPRAHDAARVAPGYD